jgi:PTS system mannose-specific IID component
MLPVIITLVSYYLLKKGWSPTRVIGVLLVIGFVGGALGIFG